MGWEKRGDEEEEKEHKRRRTEVGVRERVRREERNGAGRSARGIVIGGETTDPSDI